jgi:ParB family chromosome partitioning protein
MAKIPLSEIVDNPFQPRQSFDKESIRSLADEIEAEGFWNGTLQGRRNDKGQIELVYGHRRLRALRRLKQDTVHIEILRLTDLQMAMRSLEENLQREGLTDLERSDGVAQVVALQQRALIEEQNLSETKANARAVQIVAGRLGFADDYVYRLCQFSGLPEKTREIVEAGYLAAETASDAHAWGGDEYVKTLAKQGKEATQPETKVLKPARKTIQAMKRAVAKAPKEIQERLKQDVVEGKLTTPDAVETKARRLTTARVRREKPEPQDLRAVIIGWTRRLNEWERQMAEVEPYMDYVDEVPAIAEPFRDALKRMITTASKLLKASK